MERAAGGIGARRVGATSASVLLWGVFAVLSSLAISLIAFVREPQIAVQAERAISATTAVAADRVVIARGPAYSDLRRRTVGDIRSVDIVSDEENITATLLENIDKIAQRRHLIVKTIGNGSQAGAGDGKAPVAVDAAPVVNPSWVAARGMPVFEAYTTTVSLLGDHSSDLILALAEFSRLPIVARVEGPSIVRTAQQKGAKNTEPPLNLTVSLTVVRLSGNTRDEIAPNAAGVTGILRSGVSP